MPKKKKIRNKVTIEKEIIPELKIETLSNRELIVDGCRGVLEYGDDYIKLNTGSIITTIKGKELIIKSYDNQVTVISGIISDISFVS